MNEKIDLEDLRDNIISRRWKERYNSLPNSIRNKLNTSEVYQLQVIKRKRKYPEIGDIFLVRPRENIEYKGIVVNNHLNVHPMGHDLLVIFVFKAGVDVEKAAKDGVKREDLLIPPEIVSKRYWTGGYFYNIGHVEINEKRYGFYRIGEHKFVDEYCNDIGDEPYLLGIYGIATDIGIAIKINQEMIISGII